MTYRDCGDTGGGVAPTPPTPAPGEPRFTRFTSNTSRSVGLNTMLVDEITFTYAIANNDQVQAGTLSLEQNNSDLTATLPIGQMDAMMQIVEDSVVSVTVQTNAFTFMNAGDTVTFQMSGTSLSGASFSSDDFIITALADHQFAYYRVGLSNDFDSRTLGDFFKDDITTDNPFTISLAFPNMAWFGLLVPNQFQNVSISTLGADFTSAFTHTENVRMINNISYDTYVLQNMSGQAGDMITYIVRVR